MTEDTRTDEQVTADVAAHTLKRLTELNDELGHLEHQLELLSEWAADHEPLQSERLDNAVTAVLTLRCDCLREIIRDIAATLPIRGLDYDVVDDDQNHLERHPDD